MSRYFVPTYLLTMLLALAAGLIGLAIASWMPSDLNMTAYLVTLGLMAVAFAATVLASDMRINLASAFFMVGMMSASHPYMALIIYAIVMLGGAHAPARSPLARSLG